MVPLCCQLELTELHVCSISMDLIVAMYTSAHVGDIVRVRYDIPNVARACGEKRGPCAFGVERGGYASRRLPRLNERILAHKDTQDMRHCLALMASVKEFGVLCAEMGWVRCSRTLAPINNSIYKSDDSANLPEKDLPLALVVPCF